MLECYLETKAFSPFLNLKLNQTSDNPTMFERGGLDREFTVIKQKHRAGQFHHQNSLRFWILGTGLRVPCQRNLDFGFQSLARFQIPWGGIRIPKPRILDPKRKRFLDFRFHKPKFPWFWKLPNWADQLLVDNLQLFRERLSEKMCTWQSRKVIWDMINTFFLTTVAVEHTFVAFL